MEILSEQAFKLKNDYGSLNPLMRQYIDIKMQYQDCLLFFRLGDFYELFFEDAKIASNLLNLFLTTRNKNAEKEIAMCGMPFHSLNTHVKKLLESNYKVAICEQIESPLEAKKRGSKSLVKRCVQQILTPGTIVDESILNINQPNYIVSIKLSQDENECFFCFADVGASEIGSFSCIIFEVESEIEKLSPREILISTSDYQNQILIKVLHPFKDKVVTRDDAFFSLTKNKRVIENFYNIQTCKSISTNLSSSNIKVIGVILDYIAINQKKNIFLPKPIIINTKNFLLLESSTQKNLEIISSGEGGKKNTLFSILNKTVSKEGSRLLYRYLIRPLIDIDQIKDRLKLTRFFYKNKDLKYFVQQHLKIGGDAKRSLAKISMKKFDLQDFVNIKNTLEISRVIKDKFMCIRNDISDFPSLLDSLMSQMLQNFEIEKEICSTLKIGQLPISTSQGGFINPSYHPMLKDLTEKISFYQKKKQLLSQRYKNITGVESLKIQNNNVIGTFIEVPIKQSHKVNNKIFIHKQTTINTSRFITQELLDLSKELLNFSTQSIDLENKILNDLSEQILEYGLQIEKLCNTLAVLDVFCSFAQVAFDNEYVEPKMYLNENTIITQGRHPIIEKSLKSRAKDFIPNDCSFFNNQEILIITGPNMGGKSTFLRQNAIIVLMSQIGSFVPAREAKISVVDKIFSRIGANDNLSKGQSTFMLEMIETSSILSQATKSSLIILDEIGRGTSTYDGVSIAAACVEYLSKYLGSKCLFATHYHELVELENQLNNVVNYTTSIREDNKDIAFDYIIKKGKANKSYGIHVAKIAGLPEFVIERAKQILKKLEAKDN